MEANSMENGPSRSADQEFPRVDMSLPPDSIVTLVNAVHNLLPDFSKIIFSSSSLYLPLDLPSYLLPSYLTNKVFVSVS